MNPKQGLANTFEEFVKYNHTSNFYTYKMEYEVINDIKTNRRINILNIKTVEELMSYLEELVLDNFSSSLTEKRKLERGYDLYNQDNINENTDKYLITRNGDDFTTRIIKIIHLEYGNNFIYNVDQFYECGSIWKNVMLDFYNEFINRLLKGNIYLNNLIINAVFYEIDSTYAISVLAARKDCNESYEDYKISKMLTNDHKSKVFRVINLEEIEMQN